MVVIAAAKGTQVGELDWIWARWPRGLPGQGETPDCAIQVSWGHWWWSARVGGGRTPVVEVAQEDWPRKQAELNQWYEVYRDMKPRALDWEAGYMFDGLVVAGWFCWYDQRPILSGVEPVPPTVADYVRLLEDRSMVGPGRQRSGDRTKADGNLSVVFPKHVTPRGEWARLRSEIEGPMAEQAESSRRGSGSESSRRSRTDRERR